MAQNSTVVLDKNETLFDIIVIQVPLDYQSVLVYVMAWTQIGEKSSWQSTVILFADASKRCQTSKS